jgi:pimeloyl-ACP methyl ester carboxylesterase
MARLEATGSPVPGPATVTDLPETRYAKTSDGLQIGYQVLGEADLDLLYFVGLGSHIDLQWDSRPVSRYLRRLASFSRLILFDRRGTGVSDAAGHQDSPTWEEWTEDVRAVLDTVGSGPATIFAELDAGPTAILFAATQPDRVTSLILGNTTARYIADHDYPVGISPDGVHSLVNKTESRWGTTGFGAEGTSGLEPDLATAQRIARTFRAAATPRAAAAQSLHLGNP